MKKIKNWLKNKRQIRIFASLGLLSISLGIVIVGANLVCYIHNPQYTTDPIVYDLVMKELCISSFLLVFGIIFVLINKLSTPGEDKEKQQLQWWNKKIPLKITVVILIILGILVFFMGRFFVKEYTGVWNDLMLHIEGNK